MIQGFNSHWWSWHWHSAAQNDKTVSDFVRRAVIDMRIPDPSNNEVAKALFAVNANLARLGNLLKLDIDEGTFSDEKVESLLNEIRESQWVVKQIALKLGGKG